MMKAKGKQKMAMPPALAKAMAGKKKAAGASAAAVPAKKGAVPAAKGKKPPMVAMAMNKKKAK